MIKMKEIISPQNPCIFENPCFFKKARFWKKKQGFSLQKSEGKMQGKKAWIQKSKDGAKQGLGGAKDSWEAFAPWAQKTFCTLC